MPRLDATTPPCCAASRCGLIAAALLIATAAAIASMGCSTVRALDPSRGEPGEVARVRTTPEVHVEAVDGQRRPGLGRYEDVDSSRPVRTIELTPGEHRLAVYYFTRSNDGATRGYERSVNLTTIRHHFEGGKDYTFAVETFREPSPPPKFGGRSGVWTPVLVDGSTGLPVTHAELETRDPVPPSGSAGGSVSGIAEINAGQFHAAGRDVLLVPDAPEVRARVDRWALESAWPESYNGQPSPLRRALRSLRPRVVMGYGLGQFLFENVPPGQYLVLFAHDWRLARAEVSVGAGRTHVTGVRLHFSVPPAPPLKGRR